MDPHGDQTCSKRPRSIARATHKLLSIAARQLSYALVLVSAGAVVQAASLDTLTFHGDAQRTGWRALETVLTPSNVAPETFGLIWESPRLDGVAARAPQIFASPLYMDRVTLSAGAHKGVTFSVVFVATNAGFVYAINAFAKRDIAAGTILWRTQLGETCQPGSYDMPTGVLSTPVIDPRRKRLYVASCKGIGDWFTRTYAAYALDITSGDVVPGWPVALDRATFNSEGMNANAAFPDAEPAALKSSLASGRNTALSLDTPFNVGMQRGALNLSQDGRILYATFGESIPGWLVAISTDAARVVSTFASVSIPHGRDGGIWGAGGPAVDDEGNVYVIAGTRFNGFMDRGHDWVQSVLKLSTVTPRQGFVLRGTYTPFNYCQTAAMDIDLGAGGALLIPDLDPTKTSTPQLMAFGDKQGNLYLLDRANMPGGLDRRQPCSTDSSSDRSLLAPTVQPQFGKRGPLNVFGPYSQVHGAMDQAKSRSVPAYFRDSSGSHYLFASGSSKRDEGSSISVPPCLARVKIVTVPNHPAYLQIDQLEHTSVFQNPGSPVITSDGAKGAIVWVLDTNGPRTASLSSPNAPRPVLYAFDAMTLKLLWRSKPNELYTGGKYNEPAFARGTVFVGTDRIQAFGVRPRS